MIERFRTLGFTFGNLAKATGRLAWGVIAGPLGRCYSCGTKCVKVDFPEGCRYWAVDLGEKRSMLLCPTCEAVLLENAMHIIKQSSERK